MAEQSKNSVDATAGEATHRQKVADKLVEEARARVKTTNKTLLALFVLIAWSWLSNLSPIDLSGGKIGTPEMRVIAANQARDDLDGKCKLPDAQRPDDSKRPDDSRCSQLASAFTARMGELSTNFDLLLVKPAAMHLSFQPLLLALLIGATFLYARWSRYKVLRLLSEAVGIYRDEIKWNRNKCGVLLQTVPFWLWPLHESTSKLGSDDCAEYLAIPSKDTLRPFFLNSLTLVTFFITVHVLLTQWDFSHKSVGFQEDINSTTYQLSRAQVRQINDFADSLSLTGNAVADFILVTMISFIGPALIMLVIISRKREQNSTGDAKKDNAIISDARMIIADVLDDKHNRRTAILLLLGAAVPVIIIVLPTLRGLVSPITRFVRSNPRRHRKSSTGTWATEQRALRLLIANESRGASAVIALLLTNIVQNGRLSMPSSQLRLYDLLAGLSVRYGQESDLDRLIGLCEDFLRNAKTPSTAAKTGSQNSAPIEFQPHLGLWLEQRVAKWKSKDERWTTKWRSPEYRWNKIDLPPSASIMANGRSSS